MNEVQERIPDRQLALTTPMSQWPTNLDLTSPQGKALLISAMNPAEIDFGTADAIEVTATNYIVFPDEGVNPETGEVSQFSRVVLFNKEGKHFRTTGGLVAKVAGMAFKVFDRSDWQRGIPFRIVRRISKLQRIYHSLYVLTDDLSCQNRTE